MIIIKQYLIQSESCK